MSNKELCRAKEDTANLNEVTSKTSAGIAAEQSCNSSEQATGIAEKPRIAVQQLASVPEQPTSIPEQASNTMEQLTNASKYPKTTPEQGTSVSEVTVDVHSNGPIRQGSKISEGETSAPIPAALAALSVYSDDDEDDPHPRQGTESSVSNQNSVSAEYLKRKNNTSTNATNMVTSRTSRKRRGAQRQTAEPPIVWSQSAASVWGMTGVPVNDPSEQSVADGNQFINEIAGHGALRGRELQLLQSAMTSSGESAPVKSIHASELVDSEWELHLQMAAGGDSMSGNKKRFVDTKVWSGGGISRTVEPTRVQKNKHQINWLACEALNSEVDIQNRSGSTFMAKADASRKYGW